MARTPLNRGLVALLGAFYSTTIVAPYFIHPMSPAMAQVQTIVGALCVCIGAVAVQVREARVALRDGTPVVRAVVTSTIAFFGGAMGLIAISFLPIANAVGTFDEFDPDEISGAWLVEQLLLAFGIWMVMSAAVVISGSLINRKAAETAASQPAQSPASGSPS